jgi:hypothetical protein
MRATWFLKGFAWIAGLSVVLKPATVLACATCFGQSDAPLAKGMNMGILSLLAIVVLMWGGFIAFFVHLARRAAASSAISDGLSESTTKV